MSQPYCPGPHRTTVQRVSEFPNLQTITQAVGFKEVRITDVLNQLSPIGQKYRQTAAFADHTGAIRGWVFGEHNIVEDNYYCNILLFNETCILDTYHEVMYNCLFVFGISSGQLISELFPDCTRSCFLQVVLRHRSGDRIYEMRCLFVAVGPNAHFIVLPHWDNMS